jgi:hypothetical protein
MPRFFFGLGVAPSVFQVDFVAVGSCSGWNFPSVFLRRGFPEVYSVCSKWGGLAAVVIILDFETAIHRDMHSLARAVAAVSPLMVADWRLQEICIIFARIGCCRGSGAGSGKTVDVIELAVSLRTLWVVISNWCVACVLICKCLLLPDYANLCGPRFSVCMPQLNGLGN